MWEENVAGGPEKGKVIKRKERSKINLEIDERKKWGR